MSLLACKEAVVTGMELALVTWITQNGKHTTETLLSHEKKSNRLEQSGGILSRAPDN